MDGEKVICLVIFFLLQLNQCLEETSKTFTLFVRNKTKGKSAKANRVFRGAYGKLSILRSMCKEGE